MEPPGLKLCEGIPGLRGRVGQGYVGSGRDLAVGYALKTPRWSHVHSVKVKLQVDNLLNHDALVLSSVGATPASNGYNVLPGMNYFLTVSTEF